MPGTHKARQEGSSRSRQRPVLIVLCGPSCSGKSTFARGLPDDFRIVSSDEVRERVTGCSSIGDREVEVWQAFESLKRKALRAGRNVVLDACHMSERARWHALQGPNAGHRRICIVFDVPLGTVRARCTRRGRLPLREAERMWRAFQQVKPTADELRAEGYDAVHFAGSEALAKRRLPGRLDVASFAGVERHRRPLRFLG